MLSDFNDVLCRFDGLHLRSEHEAMALCPAHDDQNPSLSIKAEDGKLLLKCFAGCTNEQVVAAMDLKLSDLYAGDGEVVPFRTPNRTTDLSASRGIQAPPPPRTDDQGEGGSLYPPNHLDH